MNPLIYYPEDDLVKSPTDFKFPPSSINPLKGAKKILSDFAGGGSQGALNSIKFALYLLGKVNDELHSLTGTENNTDVQAASAQLQNYLDQLHEKIGSDKDSMVFNIAEFGGGAATVGGGIKQVTQKILSPFIKSFSKIGGNKALGKALEEMLVTGAVTGATEFSNSFEDAKTKGVDEEEAKKIALQNAKSSAIFSVPFSLLGSGIKNFVNAKRLKKGLETARRSEGQAKDLFETIFENPEEQAKFRNHFDAFLDNPYGKKMQKKFYDGTLSHEDQIKFKDAFEKVSERINARRIPSKNIAEKILEGEKSNISEGSKFYDDFWDLMHKEHNISPDKSVLEKFSREPYAQKIMATKNPFLRDFADTIKRRPVEKETTYKEVSQHLNQLNAKEKSLFNRLRKESSSEKLRDIHKSIDDIREAKFLIEDEFFPEIRSEEAQNIIAKADKEFAKHKAPYRDNPLIEAARDAQFGNQEINLKYFSDLKNTNSIAYIKSLPPEEQKTLLSQVILRGGKVDPGYKNIVSPGVWEEVEKDISLQELKSFYNPSTPKTGIAQAGIDAVDNTVQGFGDSIENLMIKGPKKKPVLGLIKKTLDVLPKEGKTGVFSKMSRDLLGGDEYEKNLVTQALYNKDAENSKDQEENIFSFSEDKTPSSENYNPFKIRGQKKEHSPLSNRDKIAIAKTLNHDQKTRQFLDIADIFESAKERERSAGFSPLQFLEEKSKRSEKNIPQEKKEDSFLLNLLGISSEKLKKHQSPSSQFGKKMHSDNVPDSIIKSLSQGITNGKIDKYRDMEDAISYKEDSLSMGEPISKGKLKKMENIVFHLENADSAPVRKGLAKELGIDENSVVFLRNNPEYAKDFLIRHFQ